MATCMTCTDEIEKFVRAMGGYGNSAFTSEKLDGVRVMAMVFTQGEVMFFSRSGKELHNFDKFKKDIVELRRGCDAVRRNSHLIFDGEVTAKDTKFSSVMKQLRRLKDLDSDIFQYNIFDVQSTAKLTYRYVSLQEAFRRHSPEDIKLVQHTPVLIRNEEDIQTLLKQAVDKGQEGVVLKNMSSVYEFKKSSHWLKLKPSLSLDLPVVGYKKGTGKYAKMLGALTVLYKGKFVDVGTGYTDKERVDLLANLPDLIEVGFQQESSQGSLRHPRFLGVRDDKLEHD